jgi:hypothetical protein
MVYSDFALIPNGAKKIAEMMAIKLDRFMNLIYNKS